MFDSIVNKNLYLPIRLEDSAGDPVTGKANADLTVKKCDYSDSDWAVIATGNRTLNELSEGDYTLIIFDSQITKTGFLRIKVSCSGCETKQYAVNIIKQPLDIYFKSTGSDETGDGSYNNPYQSLNKCITFINSRQGFTIHCLDNPINIAGNKDQVFDFSVTFDGHGTAWTAPTPTSYHINIGTATRGVTIRNVTNLKIDFNPSLGGHKLYNCWNCEVVAGLFSDYSIYEKCSFSNAMTGGGAESGRHSVFRDITFLNTVNFANQFDGAIFDTIRFQSDLTIGDPVQYCEFNNITVRGNLNLANYVYDGKNIFRNVYVHGNITGLSCKFNIFMGGVVRGNLNLDAGSNNNIFWQTRIKGTVVDLGTANEIINYNSWSTLDAQGVRDSMKLAPTGNGPATGSVDKHLDDILEDTNEMQGKLPAGTIAKIGDKMDLIDTLKHKAGSSGYDRTTDSMEAVGERTQAIPDKAKLKDLLFNRDVTSRHPAGPGEDKPKTIAIGTGGAEGTVTTSIDGDGNLDTEQIS